MIEALIVSPPRRSTERRRCRLFPGIAASVVLFAACSRHGTLNPCASLPTDPSGALTGPLSLSGHVADQSGAVVVGEIVTLSGDAQASRSTDFAGGYLFHPTAGSYSLNLPSNDCSFSPNPANATLTPLSGGGIQNLTATSNGCATATASSVSSSGSVLTIQQGTTRLGTTKTNITAASDANAAAARLNDIVSEISAPACSLMIAGKPAIERQARLSLPGPVFAGGQTADSTALSRGDHGDRPRHSGGAIREPARRQRARQRRQCLCRRRPGVRSVRFSGTVSSHADQVHNAWGGRCDLVVPCLMWRQFLERGPPGGPSVVFRSLRLPRALVGGRRVPGRPRRAGAAFRGPAGLPRLFLAVRPEGRVLQIHRCGGLRGSRALSRRRRGLRARNQRRIAPEPGHARAGPRVPRPRRRAAMGSGRGGGGGALLHQPQLQEPEARALVGPAGQRPVGRGGSWSRRTARAPGWSDTSSMLMEARRFWTCTRTCRATRAAARWTRPSGRSTARAWRTSGRRRWPRINLATPACGNARGRRWRWTEAPPTQPESAASRSRAHSRWPLPRRSLSPPRPPISPWALAVPTRRQALGSTEGWLAVCLPFITSKPVRTSCHTAPLQDRLWGMETRPAR